MRCLKACGPPQIGLQGLGALQRSTLAPASWLWVLSTECLPCEPPRRARRCWCTRARGWQGEPPWWRTLRLWPSATQHMGVQPTTWMRQMRRRCRRGFCYPNLCCWEAL